MKKKKKTYTIEMIKPVFVLALALALVLLLRGDLPWIRSSTQRTHRQKWTIV